MEQREEYLQYLAFENKGKENNDYFIDFFIQFEKIANTEENIIPFESYDYYRGTPRFNEYIKNTKGADQNPNG